MAGQGHVIIVSAEVSGDPFGGVRPAGPHVFGSFLLRLTERIKGVLGVYAELMISAAVEMTLQSHSSYLFGNAVEVLFHAGRVSAREEGHIRDRLIGPLNLGPGNRSWRSFTKKVRVALF